MLFCANEFLIILQIKRNVREIKRLKEKFNLNQEQTKQIHCPNPDRSVRMLYWSSGDQWLIAEILKLKAFGNTTPYYSWHHCHDYTKEKSKQWAKWWLPSFSPLPHFDKQNKWWKHLRGSCGWQLKSIKMAFLLFSHTYSLPLSAVSLSLPKLSIKGGERGDKKKSFWVGS